MTTNFFIFAYVWLSAFLLHELCHVLESIRQKAASGYICVTTSTYGLPSMYAYSLSIKDMDLFKLAGGLYSGIILLIMALVSKELIWHFSFITLAAINLYYSVYEMSFLGKITLKDFDKGRYGIYLVVFLIMLLVYYSGWVI